MMYSIFNKLLYLFLIVSWFTYPFCISFLFPFTIKMIIILAFIAMNIFLVKWYTYDKLIKDIYNYIKEDIFIKIVIFYVLLMIIATIYNNTIYSYYSVSIFIFKYFILLELILVLNYKIIINILKIYSYISLVIVIMAMIIGVLVAFDLISNSIYLTSLVNKHFLVYYGSFYSFSPLNFIHDVALFRLQGLSEEAGTFAMSIIPSLLYFLLYEKNKAKSIIIMIALMWSFSLAAFLIILLLSFLLVQVNSGKYKSSIQFLRYSAIAFFIIFSLSHFFDFTKNNESFALNREVSLLQRVDDIILAVKIVKENPIGVGCGYSMIVADKSISVGFGIRLLESGVLGGLIYIIIFIYLFYKSYFNLRNQQNCESINIIISLSVIAILLISFLRQPFDSSLWHMLFIASLLKLNTKR